MGRWRAAAARAAPYITAAGYRALEQEVRALWAQRREVVKHLAAAAAEGDRSENAEYQYRKKELRELDRRLGYLQRRMPTLNIVDTAPAQRDMVFFGACVELEEESGAVRGFRIVGHDEAQPEQGLISVDAPLARKLLGRRLDDIVDHPPYGRLAVVAIDYPDPQS